MHVDGRACRSEPSASADRQESRNLAPYSAKLCLAIAPLRRRIRGHQALVTERDRPLPVVAPRGVRANTGGFMSGKFVSVTQ
jgi:hypothetical protein